MEMVNKIKNHLFSIKIIFFNLGIHWIVLAVVENEKTMSFEVEIFDSFGREPSRREIFLALKNFKSLKYSTKQLQSCFSSTCGIYSIMYTIWRENSYHSMQKFLDKFSEKLLENDLRVLRMFQAHFSSSCVVDKNGHD